MGVFAAIMHDVELRVRDSVTALDGTRPMAMNGNRAASGNGNDSVSCSVATAGTGTVARADDLIGMGGAYAADPRIR